MRLQESHACDDDVTIGRISESDRTILPAAVDVKILKRSPRVQLFSGKELD